MDRPIDKVLLKKFIAGECSADEALAVNQFLQQPEGKILFNLVMQQQWEEMEGFEVEPESLQKWKGQLDHRLGIRQQNTQESSPVPVKRFFFRYAAIWIGLLVCFAGYGILKLNDNLHEEQKTTAIIDERINPYGRRSSFLLSDSTKVYLGAGSKLTYARTFSGNQRTVYLTGEAYFEVTKNPKKPFVIFTGAVRTMVLGTAFKINAFQGKPLTVAVTTGKVRVDHMDADHQLHSLAVLTPGLKLNYNQGKAITDQVSIEDTEKWKKGLMVFKAVPLQQLATEIGRWYDVSVTIQRKSLNNIPVSVTLDANVPVNKLLDGLAVVANLKYKFIDKHTITIY